MSDQNKKFSAPYLPFKTFISALDLIKDHAVPNRIDHSVFPSFSGLYKGQVLSAFRFLKLISDDGMPSQSLHDLAMNADNRKELMKQLLEENYGEILSLGLSRMSPSQLDQALGNEKYNVNGDTKQKAKAFFLRAAEFAGLQIAPLLTQRQRSPRAGKRKLGNPGVRNGNAGESEVPPKQQGQQSPETPAPANGTPIKTITLVESGKKVWVGTDANVLEIKKGPDRDFILALSDLFDEYEARTQRKNEEAKADTSSLPFASQS